MKKYMDREWLYTHYHIDKMTIVEIAKMARCGATTVQSWMKKLDIPRRSHSEGGIISKSNRRHHWNEGFFDTLTPDVAYVIGFIIADGWLSTNQYRANYNISISQKEKGILSTIAEAAGCDPQQVAPMGGSYVLRMWSAHAKETLIDIYGIPAGRTKSYVSRIPRVILKDDNNLPHFIRGYFDGDGTVGFASFGFTSGSSILLNQVSDVLVTKCDIFPDESAKWQLGGYEKKDGSRSGAYRSVWYSIISCRAFAQYIYGHNLDVWGSSLFLERKRKTFQQLFFEPWREEKYLREEILLKGRSFIDVAAEFDILPRKITHWLRMIGLAREWLQTEYLDKDKTLKDISDEFGLSPGTLVRWKKKFGYVKAGLLEKEPIQINLDGAPFTSAQQLVLLPDIVSDI